jgi:hypothetical protein
MIKKYPAIKGLSWHREQYYSFFVPMDWHRFVWPDDRQGVIYGPDVNDPLTSFSVDLKDLGMRVATDDLEVLSEGFFGAIGQLSDVALESHKQKISGQVLELEAIYTFCDQGTTRKCWKRVFYHVTRQITMTAQGATTDKYDYWLPIFFEAMMTANVHSQKPAIDFWA